MRVGRLGKYTEEPTLEMLIYGSPCNRTEQEFSKPVQLLGGRLSSEEHQRNPATRQPAPRSPRWFQPFAEAPVCRAAPSRGADQEEVA